MASGGGSMEDPLRATHQAVEDAWHKLDSVWKEIGYDSQLIQKRKNAMHKHVDELLNDMVSEGETQLMERKDVLEKLIKEIGILARELTLDGSVVRQAQVKAQGRTLLETESIFEEIAKELRERKGIRMEKYHKVNNKAVNLSDELGEVPHVVEFDGIPSDAQVVELEHHLTHLQKEKHRRQIQFRKLQKAIVSLFECEDLIPRNELERVISSDEDPKTNCPIKILSLKVLHEMEELEANLRRDIKCNFEEGERLWLKIRELWSRLSVDEELQNAFENVHRSIEHIVGDENETIYKPRVLKGLRNELSRLEEEKRRNMSLFIRQVREELQDIWANKCFIDEVGTRFHHSNYKDLTDFREPDFYSDLYSEELLEKHEKEGEYWRHFIERNKKIIDGINKRNHMFNQYKRLEFKSDDPARLANRGGALLKEEKERKMLEKAIPKLENELKGLSYQFEDSQDGGNGMKKFVVFGKEIPEMIESDWTSFHEEKDRRKESRKGSGAIGKTMMTTQLGPPGSRKRPATPTSTQRIGLSTPNKRNKMAPTTPVKVYSSTPYGQSPQCSSTMKKAGSTLRLNTHAPSKPRTNGGKPSSGIPAIFHGDSGGKFLVSGRPKERTPYQTALQQAARKLVRKSIGKSRQKGPGYNSNGSSLMSSSLYNSSASVKSDPKPQCDLSTDTVLKIDSMDQLNFSEVSKKIKYQDERPNFVCSRVEPPSFSYEAAYEFARPATRSRNPAPGGSTLGKNQPASKIPNTKRGKEQIDPTLKLMPVPVPEIVSPVSTYSEFTDHLLCQSTLNSSAVSTVAAIRKPLSTVTTTGATTPTKSDKPAGFAFTTPAKGGLGDEYF